MVYFRNPNMPDVNIYLEESSQLKNQMDYFQNRWQFALENVVDSSK